MSSVVISGNTSGTITLDAPAVAGTTTLTLPATSGTVLQSGTAVTVAQGGTGLTSAGSNGNVLTSDGTNWTSAALPAGGVTSLNGQTGAITNTNYDAIGSYVIMRESVNVLVGNTVAGSTLQKFNSAGSLVSAGLTGTWRQMGPSDETGLGNLLFARIS